MHYSFACSQHEWAGGLTGGVYEGKSLVKAIVNFPELISTGLGMVSLKTGRPR